MEVINLDKEFAMKSKEEMLKRANIEETARLASNYTIEEQIAVATVLDTEVMENELRSRRREDTADLEAVRIIANRRLNKGVHYAGN